LSQISVLVVDDHEIFRAGLRMVLSSFEDIAVVGEAVDGVTAVSQVESLRPAVVLMDLRMPQLDGIGATREIAARFPGTRVLIVSTFDGDEMVAEAVVAGASGYVLKASPPEDIAGVVRLCAKGYSVFGPGTMSFLQKGLLSPDGEAIDEAIARLSERELEVLRLIGRGMTNREIAAALNLSDGTVRNYVSNLLAQLSAKHRTELALVANTLLARMKLR
jgi:DNA-binding NarL/FixJ family response regulator